MAARGAAMASLPSCAAPEHGPAVPHHLHKQATMLGVANERFYLAAGGGHPTALDTVRRILPAYAALPCAFPRPCSR